MAFLFNDLKNENMIEVRKQTKYEKLTQNRDDLIAVIIDDKHHFLKEKDFLELQRKLNTFAIPVVINWVKLEDEEPDGKDKYWCVDASGSLYLCKYEQFMFRRKKQFTNCIGKGWPVDNIVKWQKLILPCL